MIDCGNKGNIEKRISDWADIAGPPHSEASLGNNRIGFWRVNGGLIRIRASRKGEFDPGGGIEITDKEIEAIMDAYKHPVVERK